MVLNGPMWVVLDEIKIGFQEHRHRQPDRNFLPQGLTQYLLFVVKGYTLKSGPVDPWSLHVTSGWDFQ